MKIFKKLVSVVIVSCFVLSIANLPAYSAYNTIETIGSAQNQEEYNLQADFKTVKETIKAPAAPLATTAKVTSSSVKAKANQSIKLINNLLKKKATGKLARTWLNKAKALINKTLKSKKSNATKYAWLKKALTAITAISKAKASTLSLVKQTVTSGSVFSSLKTVLKKNATYKIYVNYTAKINSAIDKLVKKSGISSLVKTWLNKAKTIVNNTMFGNKSNKVKTTLLKKALTAINAVVKANGSVLSVAKQTVASGSVFTSLKTVLKNNITYKIYAKYGNNGINLISAFSKKFNINQNDIYNIFVNKGVEKSDIDFFTRFILDDLNDEVFFNTWYGSDTINEAIAEIKRLIDNANDENNNNTENNENNNNENNNENNNNENNNENNNNDNPTQKPYQQSLNESTVLINNLLNNNNTSNLAKSWLNAAQNKINEIANSNKTDEEKEELINAALASIQNVSNSNCSIEVLEQESAEGGIFSSLQETVLNDNPDYQAYQIAKTYSEESIAIANTLSQKTGLSQSIILQQFAKAGVTNEQLAENADNINNGGNFVNNSAVALSRVLNVDQKLIAVQQLAVAVAKGSNISSDSSLENQLEVIKMNGKENAAVYTNCTLDDVISNLKAGEGIVLKVISGVSSVSVVKKNDNCFIVTDKDFTQNGTIVGCEYTADELRKLMNNESAKFSFILNGYIYTGSRNYWYNPANSDGKISFVTDSTGIREGEDAKLSSQYLEPMIASIDDLLNEPGTSQLAKDWLNKAKEIISGIINTNESVSEEERKLQQLEESINRIEEQNASIASILQETSSNNLFSSLQEEVLSKDDNINNIIYPFYVQNVQESVSAINNLLDNEDLGEVEQDVLNGVYNLVVNVLNEIINIVNSGNRDYSTQEQWLQQAAASIENIKNDNASFTVLDQETQEGKVFAPLRETLESAETFQIYQTFGDLGAKAIRSFAKYMNVLESVVFQQFVRFNVTAERLQNVANSLINVINKKANFFNCASLAVSKYLGINRTLAVIQDIAADISLGHGFGTDWMGTVATNNDSVEKVLQLNGRENAMLCAISSMEDLMTGLQVGEQAILAVYCYGLGGHAITIRRETNGWGVFDVNRNGGEEVIYTPENFITLMTGTKATIVQGIKTDGTTYNDKVYYTAMQQYQHSVIEVNGSSAQVVTTYPQGIKLITDSEGILSKRDEHAILK